MQSVMEIDADKYGMKSGVKQLLTIMANFANDDGEGVYPSNETLSWYTGQKVSTIKANKKRALEGELIIRNGVRWNNIVNWRLNVELIKSMKRTNKPGQKQASQNLASQKTDSSQPESGHNPIVNHELKIKDKDYINNSRIKTLLKSYGISNPMRDRLAAMPHMEIDFVKDHIKQANKEMLDTPLLIIRLRDNDPSPARTRSKYQTIEELAQLPANSGE